uniref:CD44 antigen n=2 Tax=Mus spicilegus TaxID=10103 RepID=A0A8C6GHG8_MUSSI
MDKFWWHTAWGLCLLQLSLAQQQIDLNVTCRYAGVFHVEKNGRYSISRTEAADLCQAFNSTLPTMDQMKLALSKGFETCRYGFIEGNVVIPRIHPNAICAANHTGVYILVTSNTSYYDTYCFNASAPPEEDCTSVTDLPNSFDGPVTITIVNRDGTRYSKKGEYRTHQEDINASNIIDDDVSSGSTIEKSTPESYILHTYLPTEQPTGDQDDSFFIRSTLATIATTPRVSARTEDNQDWTQWKPNHSNLEVLLQTTTRMADIDRISTSAHGENWTPEPQPPFNNHEYQDEEETPHATSTTPNSTAEAAATQQETWFQNGWQGKNPPTPSEDSHVTEGTTASAHNNHPSQRITTQSQEDVSWTDFFDPISHPMGQGHQTESKGDRDSSKDSRGGSRTVTHGSELAGHSSGNQDSGVTTTSGPMRRPQIPEWLIILASLLALALILAVCIAVNSRRRCGQKKKLVINGGNGTVEDRKPSELNGEASKSQEMVHLVNKEPSETPDQCMTADETRNLQSVDMKIGV